MAEDKEPDEHVNEPASQYDANEPSMDESDEDDNSEEMLTDSFPFIELPSEIFLHICSFLDAKFVKTLGCVCKLFNNIISNDTFWKVRIRKRWPKMYPPIPVNDECFNWQEACVKREEQHRLWCHPDETMDYYNYSKGLFAPVDSVHLMKKGSLLAVGSRDRYLHILDLTRLRSGDPESVKDIGAVVKMNAHKGWIWTIKSLDNMLSTGSWDMHVKFWDMAADCTQVQDIKLKSAALCSHYEPGFYAVGGYDKRVYHIDPRAGTIICEKKYHKQPVLCMEASDNYIVTGSEDTTICVYDRRADHVLHRIQLESYPMSMSYTDDQMWVGDKSGFIHVVDATDGDFNVVDTYDVGHKGKITSIISTWGATFTSSTDKTIKVLEPSVHPGVITTLDKQTAEVARIDYQNNVLAIANSSVSVGIYTPKDIVQTW